MDVAFEAEDAMSSHKGVCCMSPDFTVRDYWLKRNRIARNLTRFCPHWSPDIFIGCGYNLFFFLMWCDKRVFATMRNPRKRKWVYIFDSWEPHWESIKHEMMQWRNIGAVYFSSSQTADYFRSLMTFPIRWCPQATTFSATVDADVFDLADDQLQRSVVLNIGRSNAILSAFFEKFCTRHGMEYIYQKDPEQILFPNRNSFYRILKRSRIVVVHPRNIDSPEVTGCVSMLTARYFEAYHSGSVVCGFKPSSGEFERVMDGLPFVEYHDPVQFESDLLQALNQPEIWHAAREKIRSEHSWIKRTGDILREAVVDACPHEISE